MTHDPLLGLPKTMDAAVLVAPKRFEIQRLPVPRPGPDEILVRVEMCGVCQSEVSAWNGGSYRQVLPYPEVLDVMEWSLEPEIEPAFPRRWGHEMVGCVVEVGTGVHGLAVGDAVTGLVSGAFAGYCVLPEKNAVGLQHSLSTRTFGEPIACVANADARAKVEEGDVVVVIGTGYMNLMLLQLLRRSRPNRIVAVDLRKDVLERARAVGADIAINAGDDDFWSQLTAAVGPRGADVVIEGTGHPDGIALAGQVSAIRGRIVIVGFHRGDRREIDLELWNIKGVDVINAHERSPAAYMEGMRAGVELVASGDLKVESLVTHEFELSDIGTAFDVATSRPPGFVKAAISTTRTEK